MGSEFSEMLYSVVFVNPSLGAAVIAMLLENCNCVAVEEDPILYIQSKVHVIDISGDEDATETDDELLEQSEMPEERSPFIL